ncbi:MerR family transcriptional regulator [Aphanothece hegewaldii CCALA 016]|uniref:MerR family transcriptional regulator n=1 Tax=Aphanothece hegewaldii CCALA 016 TaxID=2107694 RepID=A0A2T1LSQ3_9CHRO|nr:MerR family transcriptional regulator [Aphanothece hegewaldii]PSF33081.1 MerR family transcriptional regulator [Aphanothece hegewaldii CCALA 016]
MEDTFFTSTEASQITGCSRRQLQYWREKGVIVPTVNASGKGRNVYYSMSNLLELLVMEYLLSVGLSFETAQESLEMLKQKQPELFNPNASLENLKRLMIFLSPKSLELKDFDSKEAFKRINTDALPLVPFSGEIVHQHLQKNLERFKKKEFSGYFR